MLIYIAGPYRGNVEENIKKARELAARCYKNGHNCITPHLNSGYMDIDTGLGDEFWLKSTMELLKKCDAICMVKGWEESVGSVAEFRYAVKVKMPVYIESPPEPEPVETEHNDLGCAVKPSFTRMQGVGTGKTPEIRIEIKDSIEKQILDPIFKGFSAKNPKPKNSIFDAADPNCETVTHANGASESKTDLRFDLLPPVELAMIAKVLGEGAVKYGENNWYGISTASNLNHALQHIFAWIANDRSDDHLSHATTRLLFAMWKDNNQE